MYLLSSTYRTIDFNCIHSLVTAKLVIVSGLTLPDIDTFLNQNEKADALTCFASLR